MIFVYPDTISTFVGSKETAIKTGYIEVTEEVYNELVDNKKMWSNGQIIDNPTYEEKKQQESIEESKRKEQEELRAEHAKLKMDLKKYKEDVEQVELFGMDREDYETKKELCISIILKLRELEAKLE